MNYENYADSILGQHLSHFRELAPLTVTPKNCSHFSHQGCMPIVKFALENILLYHIYCQLLQVFTIQSPFLFTRCDLCRAGADATQVRIGSKVKVSAHWCRYDAPHHKMVIIYPQNFIMISVFEFERYFQFFISINLFLENSRE